MFITNDRNIALFEELMQEIDKLGFLEREPKAERLIKGIIFIEYKDSAEYLKPILEKHFGKRVLPAIGNLSKNTVEKIYTNFDAQYHKQDKTNKEIKIAISTSKSRRRNNN